ncbi:2-hydroxycarboxylate transporter family protein [Fructilactobacillus vespulae]|uniref:2-hydroxycarboxylate transporter family protein n=1 Tax=Fructilactobacillus vespulae TaxID=1249630 RepID=UPI0039B407B0
MKKTIEKIDGFKIDGIGLVLYALVGVIFLLIINTGLLPNNMMGALFTMVVLGNVFYYLGAHLPIFRSYLGGGAVFALFGGAILTLTGLVPASVGKTVETFISSNGFIDFFILSLIVGAILGMDRKLLLRASVRFLPVAFLSMAVTLLVTLGVSELIGKGFRYGAMNVAFPVMGGGIGAGAIPLSQIYHQTLGGPEKDYLSNLLPAVILGNVVAIMGASLLSKLAENSKYNGHGVMMPGSDVKTEKTAPKIVFQKLGVGLLIALSFYMVAKMLTGLVPSVNEYAFLILLVIVFKASGFIPKYYEESAVTFSNSITKNLTHALLVSVGLTKLDLPVLADSLNWQFVVLVLTALIAISLSAAVFGKLFGLYPVESAITAGMINNSMGGTGNIAVLAACDRMSLIGFAQMGNRLGGAIMLVVAGLFVSIFG